MSSAKNYLYLLFILVFLLLPVLSVFSQTSTTHTRGKLWETLYNYGYIGDPGAWDYLEITGIGFYPGFPGYTYPDNELKVYYWPKVDANFHNFRSGPWIIAKDAQTLVPPDYHSEPRDFLLWHASLSGEGQETGRLYSNPNFVITHNFIDNEDFNPLLPEEMNYVYYHTATGITVKQRSMAWSFPDYDDFIIYDYTFVNQGEMAIPALNETKKLEQTYDEVWIVFHSGLTVSTKGFLNFHQDEDFEFSVAPAGGFGGWQASDDRKGGFSDYYGVENDKPDGKGTLFYSRDYNGGREPVPWDPYQHRNNWQRFVRLQPDWLPELQDPACFGWLMLYRTPPQGANPDPYDADPTYFNIYSDERDTFKGRELDFEGFDPRGYSLKDIFEYATHSVRPPNEGDLYCWYTATFGPYSLAPGDSVKLIIAEIAGVMDMKQVAMGDPNHWYPDSSIAALHRNVRAARQAVKWGMGAEVEGIKLVADVPEPPPPPGCSAATISMGTDTAIIAVRWDKLAEQTSITDGSGGVFYDGSADLDGYRIFRTFDDRGVWWDLVEEIPRSQFDDYWSQEDQEYIYLDKDLNFGFSFKYYVQAYNIDPGPWTSANGTVVNDLGEQVSDDYNQTQLVSARPGPEDLAEGWDVFVAPNPYVEGDPERSFGEPTPRKIEFRKLPERARIRIYSLSGDLIITLEHGPDEFGNLFGSTSWDQRSDDGLLVAPGLYVYVVESLTGGYVNDTVSGKLMIVR
ncbi:hypothetical protein GF407_15635 [candidate division KSB1 bacterium]|nr:hypothetical protein [candidate division KSB1 bacterium]